MSERGRGSTPDRKLNMEKVGVFVLHFNGL